ncbi:MAG: hypothetical protein FD180_1517 [Planctomycetota bacterium]|nr:MAG: hypothetical protein FD180_1517 [Planctomycetota bacterium]
MRTLNLAATLFLTGSLLACADDANRSSKDERHHHFTHSTSGLVFDAESQWKPAPILSGGDENTSAFAFGDSSLTLAAFKTEPVGEDEFRFWVVGIKDGFSEGLEDFKCDRVKYAKEGNGAVMAVTFKKNGKDMGAVLAIQGTTTQTWVYYFTFQTAEEKTALPAISRALDVLGSTEFTEEAARKTVEQFVSTLKNEKVEEFLACLDLDALGRRAARSGDEDAQKEARKSLESEIRESFTKGESKAMGQVMTIESVELNDNHEATAVLGAAGRPKKLKLTLSPTTNGWRVTGIGAARSEDESEAEGSPSAD